MSIRLRLTLASALMLFLELSLIRWLGANVVHLSYFSNFVLLGSFLGIGLGFLRSAGPNHPNNPLPFYSPIALIALIGFVSAYPVTVNRTSSDLIFFSSLQESGPPIWATLPLLFLTVAAILAGAGEMVGACFRQLPRLDAYRFDLIGSLIGIVVFTGFSFLGAPPLVWFGVVALLYIALLGQTGLSVSVVVALTLLVMLLYPLKHSPGKFWSPYYEVSTTQTHTADEATGAEWDVKVNGIPHQRLTSAATRIAQEPYYTEPYKRIPKAPGRMLIVGAGTGTDVAIALQQGATHIDAVEIDPTLQRFGQQNNPDRAYDSDKVTVHINDGRAYLQQTKDKFDLIMFALPDSLTLVSGASSLRLESYLFTLQSMETAKAHLNPGGAFAMYNFYREQWLVDRLAGTLDKAFGHSPCIYTPGANFAVMVAGLTPADQVCEQTWDRSAAVAAGGVPDPATDDKPFLYLRTNTVPSLYITALTYIMIGSALAILLVLLLNSLGAGPGRRRYSEQLAGMWSYRDLFLLGAAFLLMETRSVTSFALLFGTTWLVNALVFGGVLVAVLAAVEVTRRVATPKLSVMYGILLGGLALNWLVPTSWLFSMPFALRLVVASIIAFLPIFAANIIFAKRFSDTGDGPLAFGTNLLGAMLGGCLEYLSLMVGYHALLILAGILYIGAYLAMPRDAREKGDRVVASPTAQQPSHPDAALQT
ncbi:MAG: spermidine synthase [Frankiales bacterium]|nr:spermidine synthase [Frankiales bacterium]